jgi:hypothetical protein
MKAVIISDAEQREFERQHDLADAALDALLDALPPTVDGYGVLYSLWCDIIPLLCDAGWTAKDLSKDLKYYVAEALAAEAADAEREKTAA